MEHPMLHAAIRSGRRNAYQPSLFFTVWTSGQVDVIRPCVIDTELSILGDLFQNASGDSSKRQKHAAKAAAEAD
ncbi:hypothetical protein COOONC_03404 [Cooperia oncophora]